MTSGAFQWVRVEGREYLECVPLGARARHLFSTRQLELPAEPALRRANMDAFARALGVEPVRMHRGRQVHGRAVHVAGDAPADGFPDADAVIATAPQTACAVQVADCVPILMAGRSEVRGAGGSGGSPVAAVHAGWRGTAAGIAGEAVAALAGLGVDPSTLVAAIGPSIRACCYQVDARVRDVFAAGAGWPLAEASFAPDGPGHWRLDVAAINRRRLEAAGVPADQIFDSELCTACDLARFYSYRVEGAGTGRLVAGIVSS
jgi:YfiH family protein